MHASDLEVLDALTKLPSTSNMAYSGGHDHLSHPIRRRPLDTLQALRRPPIDPIVFAASLSTGPHVTRHHFLHSFGPKVESKQMKRSERNQHLEERTGEGSSSALSPDRETNSLGAGRRPRAGSYANCDADSRSVLQEVEGVVNAIETQSISRPTYPSRQAPRSERLRIEKEKQDKRQQASKPDNEGGKVKSAVAQVKARPDLVRLPSEQLDLELIERKERLEKSRASQVYSSLQTAHTGAAVAAETLNNSASFSSIVRPPPLHVRCYARTRIPTPHGEIFCHLYKNNRDQKEHLALVIDPAQNHNEYENNPGRLIRSRTLDEVWGPTETEMERIVRGAYVGRLGPTIQRASQPHNSSSLEPVPGSCASEAPLVRIHSECYTGETIGSQRCDCGEQLDEAIRLIHADSQPAKGVVVYLRQEGRGIGLLDKLMAYNLQDMGHDTVAANILLGHLADARKYDIAAEILRDLGVASCRLLTNNPEKMEALEMEGITVTRRVAMVPRIWRMPAHTHGRRRQIRSKRSQKARLVKPLDASIVSQFDSDGATHTQARNTDDEDTLDSSLEDEGLYSDDSHDSYMEHLQRRAGATMVGGSVTQGPELVKYLRTKVEKMGHMLELPSAEQQNKQAGSTVDSLDDDDERILIRNS